MVSAYAAACERLNPYDAKVSIFSKIEVGERRVQAVLPGAVDKPHALFFHDGFILLAHRGAQDVGLLERVASQRLSRAHDLLLVHDHAVSIAQHRLQERMVVLDRLLAMLAIDIMLHHRLAVLDRVERPRTKQRSCRDHLVEAGRLELADEAAHPRAFKLEHADGVAAREHLVGVGVVQPQAVQVRRLFAACLDQSERVGNQRQVLEREEVELDKPDVLDALHRILRDRQRRLVAFLVDVQRHEVGERLIGNDDARRVPRSVTQQALELECVVEKIGMRACARP